MYCNSDRLSTNKTCLKYCVHGVKEKTLETARIKATALVAYWAPTPDSPRPIS